MDFDAKKGMRDVTPAAISIELRVFARKRWPLENDKFRKNQLKSALGFTARRIRSFWEGSDTAVPRTEETDAIEGLIGKKIGAAAELEEAQHEHRDLAQLASGLQALLFGPEADFYRPQVDAIRAALLSQGGGAATGSTDYGPGDRDRSFAATAEGADE